MLKKIDTFTNIYSFLRSIFSMVTSALTLKPLKNYAIFFTTRIKVLICLSGKNSSHVIRFKLTAWEFNIRLPRISGAILHVNARLLAFFLNPKSIGGGGYGPNDAKFSEKCPIITLHFNKTKILV